MILGLTGAIGCGKSTACARFVHHNWQLFDADAECHRLYSDASSPLAGDIRSRWGDECYDENGRIVRKLLGEKVFASDKELAVLTGLLYPALFARMAESIAAAREKQQDLLCEVPLLFECGTEHYFDKVGCVWCSREIRHRRLREMRGLTDEEISARESRQWDADLKLSKADIGFINNGGAEFLYRQIDDFIKENI